MQHLPYKTAALEQARGPQLVPGKTLPLLLLFTLGSSAKSGCGEGPAAGKQKGSFASTFDQDSLQHASYNLYSLHCDLGAQRKREALRKSKGADCCSRHKSAKIMTKITLHKRDKPKEVVKVSAAFGDDQPDAGREGTSGGGFVRAKRTANLSKEAIEYDAVYDRLDRNRAPEDILMPSAASAEKDRGKPKYMHAILARAQERREERELVRAEAMRKELESVPKEQVFVTPGYKKRLAELEQRRRDDTERE